MTDSVLKIEIPTESASFDFALASILPVTAQSAYGPIPAADAFLFPCEAAHIRNSAAERQREFAAGRTYARRALSNLGLGDAQISVGPDREPLWPTTVVGSLSHTHDFCIAVVAPATILLGLGVDVEDAVPLDSTLIPFIMTEAECAAHTRESGCDNGMLIFSIKESVFKAYFPQTRSFLQFHDTEVTLDPQHRAFRARIIGSRPPLGGSREVYGRYEFAGGRILSCAWAVR